MKRTRVSFNCEHQKGHIFRIVQYPSYIYRGHRLVHCLHADGLVATKMTSQGNRNYPLRANQNDPSRGNQNDLSRGNQNDLSRGNQNDPSRGNQNDLSCGN